MGETIMLKGISLGIKISVYGYFCKGRRAQQL